MKKNKTDRLFQVNGRSVLLLAPAQVSEITELTFPFIFSLCEGFFRIVYFL